MEENLGRIEVYLHAGWTPEGGNEKERRGYLYSHIPKGSNSSAHVLF